MTSRGQAAASKQNGRANGLESSHPRPLSRSPHPYRRRGQSLSHSLESPKSRENAIEIEKAHTLSSTSSSESGTEADDERGSYLKVLPAPPLRGRKGLRGSAPEKQTPGVSPLPTPPLAEEVATSFFTHVSPPQKENLVPEHERREVREKYTKRKQAEIIRRALETALLIAIGLVTFRQASNAATLQKWGPEILGFLCAISLVYLAYPFRLSWTYFRIWKTPMYALQRGFHIPSRFDPGSLLYPIFIPPFVAASLFHHMPDAMLTNMVLGLSSLPQELVPGPVGWNPVHWILSMAPLITAEISRHFYDGLSVQSKLVPQTQNSLEGLSLLYPLHISLLPTLNFLVTTSLDPAELQLLSAALINLFLFAAAPQSQILKALLWLGGVALFVSCRQLLNWELTLARIPNWKFRRQKHKQKSFWMSLDAKVCHHLISSTIRGKPRTSNDIDSDSDSPFQSVRRLRNTLTLDVRRASHSLTNGQPVSAVDTSRHEWSDVKSTLSVRRNTFSAKDGDGRRTTPSGRLKRSMTPSSSAFLNLTQSQAQVRKWVYALCTYMVALFVIFVPIRRYISTHALSQKEPFGWALGYLFGNIPEFRFQVVYHSLERWIRLPESASFDAEMTTLAGVEYIRQIRLGPANTRLVICVYCITVLLTGILAVLQLTSLVEVDTRRKVFHGIMVAMFLPTIFVDPCFIALALTLILSIFLLLDLFRASQLPPIARPITNFLAPYVDGRDHRGPIIVSHIFLLIGCAIPLWLTLAGLPRSNYDPWAGWDVRKRDISMVSGVVCVGLGDAAASLIGRRYGKTKWFWGGGKSLEGSTAFTIAVTVGLMISHAWLIIGGWRNQGSDSWMMTLGKAAAAAAGASMTETLCTSANDNVIVPIALWLLVRGLEV